LLEQLGVAICRIDPRKQIRKIMMLVEPVGTPEPLTEQRQVALGQQSHRDDALRTIHLFLPSVTQSYSYGECA